MKRFILILLRQTVKLCKNERVERMVAELEDLMQPETFSFYFLVAPSLESGATYLLTIVYICM